jgi:hypothetical protein
MGSKDRVYDVRDLQNYRLSDTKTFKSVSQLGTPKRL